MRISYSIFIPQMGKLDLVFHHLTHLCDKLEQLTLHLECALSREKAPNLASATRSPPTLLVSK
jgi:hypothetical protein